MDVLLFVFLKLLVLHVCFFHFDLVVLPDTFHRVEPGVGPPVETSLLPIQAGVKLRKIHNWHLYLRCNIYSSSSQSVLHLSPSFRNKKQNGNPQNGFRKRWVFSFLSGRSVETRGSRARAFRVFSFGSSPSSAGRLRMALESKPLNTTALVSSSSSLSLSLSLSLLSLSPVCRFYFE